MDISLLQKIKSLNGINYMYEKNPTANFPSFKLSKSNLNNLKTIIKLDFENSKLKNTYPKWSMKLFNKYISQITDPKEWINYSTDIISVLKCFYVETDTIISNNSTIWKEVLRNVIYITYETANISQMLADMVCSQLGVLLLDLLTQRLPLEEVSYFCDHFNMCLQQASAPLRMHLARSLPDHMSSIANMVLSCGVYSLQVCLLESLLLLSPAIDQSLAEYYPVSDELTAARDMLKNLTFEDFDNDCRIFLNLLNEVTKKVFSVECEKVNIGNLEVYNNKMTSSSFQQFWVDFNCGSSTITMYCKRQQLYSPASSPQSWDLVTIPTASIRRVSLSKTEVHRKIDIELSMPAVASSQEGTEALQRAGRSLHVWMKPQATCFSLSQLTMLLPTNVDVKLDDDWERPVNVQKKVRRISIIQQTIRRQQQLTQSQPSPCQDTKVTEVPLLPFSQRKVSIKTMKISKDISSCPLSSGSSIYKLPEKLSNINMEPYTSSVYQPIFETAMSTLEENFSEVTQLSSHLVKHFSNQAAQMVQDQYSAEEPVAPQVGVLSSSPGDMILPSVNILPHIPLSDEENSGPHKDADLTMEKLLNEVLLPQLVQTPTEQVHAANACTQSDDNCPIKTSNCGINSGEITEVNIVKSQLEDVIPATPVKQQNVKKKRIRRNLRPITQKTNEKKELTVQQKSNKSKKKVSKIILAAPEDLQKNFTEEKAEPNHPFDNAVVEDFFNRNEKEGGINQEALQSQPIGRSDSDFSMDHDFLPFRDESSDTNEKRCALTQDILNCVETLTEEHVAESKPDSDVIPCTAEGPTNITKSMKTTSHAEDRVSHTTVLPNPTEITPQPEKSKQSTTAEKPEKKIVRRGRQYSKNIIKYNTPKRTVNDSSSSGPDTSRRHVLNKSKRRKLYSPKDDERYLARHNAQDQVENNIEIKLQKSHHTHTEVQDKREAIITAATSYDDIKKIKSLKTAQKGRTVKASQPNTTTKTQPRAISVPKYQGTNIRANNSYRNNNIILTAADKKLFNEFNNLMNRDSTDASEKTTHQDKTYPGDVYSDFSDLDGILKKSKPAKTVTSEKSTHLGIKSASKKIKKQSVAANDQPVRMVLRSRNTKQARAFWDRTDTNELLDEVLRCCTVEDESKRDNSIVNISTESIADYSGEKPQMIPLNKPSSKRPKPKAKKVLEYQTELDSTLPSLCVEMTVKAPDSSLDTKVMEYIQNKTHLLDTSLNISNISITLPPDIVDRPIETHRTVTDLNETIHQIDTLPPQAPSTLNQEPSNENNLDKIAVSMDLTPPVTSRHFDKEVQSGEVVTDNGQSIDIVGSRSHKITNELSYESNQKDLQNFSKPAERLESELYSNPDSVGYSEKVISQPTKIYSNMDLEQLWLKEIASLENTNDSEPVSEEIELNTHTVERVLPPIYEEENASKCGESDSDKSVATPELRNWFDISKYQTHFSPIKSVSSSSSLQNYLLKNVPELAESRQLHKTTYNQTEKFQHAVVKPAATVPVSKIPKACSRIQQHVPSQSEASSITIVKEWLSSTTLHRTYSDTSNWEESTESEAENSKETQDIDKHIKAYCLKIINSVLNKRTQEINKLQEKMLASLELAKQSIGETMRTARAIEQIINDKTKIVTDVESFMTTQSMRDLKAQIIKIRDDSNDRPASKDIGKTRKASRKARL